MSLIKVAKHSVRSLAAVRGMAYLEAVHAAAEEESELFYFMDKSAYDVLCREWAAGSAAPPRAPDERLFDRVLLINRTCRTDRWARVQKWWAEAGMARTTPLERFTAVEGKRLPMPAWWYAGGAAWGCAQSHIRAIEHSLVRGDSTVLLLEDDVCFTPDFKTRTAELLAALPPDWDQFYLGGQYLQQRYAPPWRMSRTIRETYNVNRTHAYALSRAGMHKVYAFLTDYPRWQRFRGNAHIDHYLGKAHNLALWSTYTPNRWVCGQGGGLSDLTGSYAAPVYWDLPDTETYEHTPVIVAGAMRSGTSITTGVLAGLGVYMGDSLIEPDEAANPDGFFEDSRVWSAYSTGFDPYTGRQNCQDTVLIDALSCVRRAAFSQRRRVFGVKHPYIMMRPDLVKRVMGGAQRVVHVVRDRAATTRSLVKTGWYPAADCAGITDRIADATERAVASFKPGEVLVVRYEDLLANPLEQALRLARFIGVGKTKAAAAARLVKPNLNGRKHDV